MKKIILLCIVMLSMFSCKKDTTSLDVKNTQWYKNLPKPCGDICKTQIVKAKYNNEIVYYSRLSGELCDPIFTPDLINFNGQIVKSYDITDQAAFNQEVTTLEIIYSCD